MAWWNNRDDEEEEEETGSASSRVIDAVRNLYQRVVDNQRRAVEADQAVARETARQVTSAPKTVYSALDRATQSTAQADLAVRRAQTQKVQDAARNIYGAYQQQQERAARDQMAEQTRQRQAQQQRMQAATAALYRQSQIQQQANRNQAETMRKVYGAANQAAAGGGIGQTLEKIRNGEDLLANSRDAINKLPRLMADADLFQGYHRQMAESLGFDQRNEEAMRREMERAGYTGEQIQTELGRLRESPVDPLDRYRDTESDTWQGQVAANYELGELQNQADLIIGQGVIDNNQDMIRRGMEMRELAKQYANNNQEALNHDSGWLGNMVFGNLAQHAPQALLQQAAALPAQILPTLLPNKVTEAIAQATGSGAMSYRTMAGAAYIDLIEKGADHETAARMAMDEAAISAAIESADTFKDWAFGPLSGLNPFEKIGEKAATKLAGRVALGFGKWAGNTGQEYSEEASQEMVSMANERRLADGNTDGGWLELMGYTFDQAKETVPELFDVWKKDALGLFLKVPGAKERFPELLDAYKGIETTENAERANEAGRGGAIIGGFMSLFGQAAGAVRGSINSRYNRAQINQAFDSLVENTDAEDIGQLSDEDLTDAAQTARDMGRVDAAEILEAELARRQQPETVRETAPGNEGLRSEFAARVAEPETAQIAPERQAAVEQAAQDIRNAAQQGMTPPIEQYNAPAQTQQRTPGLTLATEAGRLGDVEYDAVDYNALNDTQRSIVDATGRMAEALGLDVTVINAAGNVGGAYQKGGKIYLNIASGMDLQGFSKAIAESSFAHELGHWMKDAAKNDAQAAADYQALQDMVLGAMSEDQLESLIQEKLAAEPNLTREGAIEEVVSDAIQPLLQDSKAFEQMARENPSLAQRILDFLKQFLDRIRDAFGEVDYSDNLPIYHAVQAIEGSLGEMQETYDRALLSARDYQQRRNAEQGTTGSAQMAEANQTTERAGVTVDAPSESAAPSAFSRFTWEGSDYVKDRDNAAVSLANALGISKKKAGQYIDSINSVAKAIADDAARLDYEASPGRSALVGNTEYGGSIDFSTLCKKRRVLTGTFSEIQKALPNTALTAEEVLTIRKMMKDRGYEVSCGLCYVEGSRAKMGEYAQQFLNEYARTNPEYMPNMAEVNTPEGIERIRMEHPDTYAAYEQFMNKLAQRKPKLYQMATEYNNEVLEKFDGKPAQVEKYNRNGGLRLQSFSDFEIIHLIDNMQVIMDMSRVGLNGQAYTKVPEFAWAMGQTGLKINLSLIAEGVDADGNLILDEVEGMKQADAAALRNAFPDNVGTIVVAFNDEQLLAAMKDPFIDFIIPFHRSQWNKAQYALMGLPQGAKDYTPWQNESYIEPVLNKNGKPTRPSNYMPNEYWDFSKTGKENAEAYLKMCAENNRTPKFSHLLDRNPDGSYSLKADGSTDGYWKTLIDFKMYNNDGVGVPQQPVQPIFNDGPATDPHSTLGMLEAYKGGHQSFPVAQDVVDDFVNQYKSEHEGVQFQRWGETENEQTQEAENVNAEYMTAVKNGNTRVQEQMVQEAAVQAGAIEDPKRPGKPLKLYHGTPSFGFTVFNTPTIFTTDNQHISSGYGGNIGYADPRKISDAYTPDDGSFDTLKKNAKSIMGRSIRKATDADRTRIINDLRKTAEQLQERLDKLWTDEATDVLYKVLGDETFTSEPDEYGYSREADYDNAWTYMNTPIWDMTGYSAEEILESYATEDIRSNIEKYFAYKDAFRRAISDHWDEIKGTPAEGLANFIRSFDIGDLAIDMRYSLLPSLREDAIVYEDTGKIGTEENLREIIERQKDLGSYELYGFAGDNQLVVDCKGKIWYNITVPGLTEVGTTTDAIMKKAKAAGYTSVLFKDLLDPAMNDYSSNIASNVYVFFDSNQVKSADRVTYDDSGNVIPLSERFNKEKPDIRFQTWNSEENQNAGDIRQQLRQAEQEYMRATEANDPDYDYRGQLDRINELRRQVQEAEQAGNTGNDSQKTGDKHPERGEIGSDGLRVCKDTDALEAELNDAGAARFNNDTGEYKARIRQKSEGGVLLTVDRDGKRAESKTFGTAGEAAAYAASFIDGQTRARTDAELDNEKSAPVPKQEPIEAAMTGQVQDEARRQKQNKAAEASTQSLRDRIRKTDGEIKALRRLEKTTGLTDTQKAHLQDLQETLEILNDELTSRKGRAKAKKEKVEVKGNKPVRSAAEAKNVLFDTFHTAQGQRVETGQKIDTLLSRVQNEGRITEQDRQDLFDMLLDAGAVREEAAEELKDVRDWLRGARIYVSEHDRADFGDDWNTLRKRAFAAGIYLTNNETDRKADSLNAELAETFGENMFPTDVALSDMLANMIDRAEAGKSRLIPFAQAIESEAKGEGVDAQEIYNELSAKLDETLRTFAEKAKLEVELKDRTASMLATERKRAEDRLERMAQRRRESQIREKTFKAIRRLKKLRGRAAADVKTQIDEAIRDIDTQARQLTINGIEDLQELARVYEDAKKAAGYVDAENPGNFISNPYIEEKLARLTQKHINDMDIDEVIELGRVVSALENTVKNNGKMIGEQFDAEVKAVADQVDAEVRSSRGAKPGFMQKWFAEEQLSPRRFLEMLGGWKKGAMANLADSLEKGQTRMLDFQRRAAQLMDPFMNKKENRKWLKTASGKNAKWYTYSVANGLDAEGGGITGQTIEITPMMKVSLYLASLNEDNLRHIQTGGLVIPDKALYMKGKTQEAFAQGKRVKMQPEAVRHIAASLTQEEKTFAGYLQKFFNTTSKDAINEVSVQLDGFERADVEQYFPIESSKAFLKSDVSGEARAQTVEGIGSIANERVHASNPIVLDDAYNVFMRQVDKVSRYYGYAIPMRNFNAVNNYVFHEKGNAFAGSIKDTINHKWGAGAENYITKMLQDIQSGVPNRGDMTSRFLSKLRGNLAGATLTLNPSVAISQTASYPGAAQAVGWDGLAAGLVGGPVDEKLVEKYTPLLWYRSQGYSTQEIGDAVSAQNKSLAQKALSSKALNWIQTMDRLAVKRIWKAAEYRVTKDTGLKPGSRELIESGMDPYYQKVAEVFNRAVYDTQPNYTDMERAQILRSESDITKFLTMYKTVPLQYYGMTVEAVGRMQAALKNGNKAEIRAARKYAADTFGGLLAANSVYVIMKALFKSFRGKDKDYREEGEITPESYFKQLGRDLMETYAGSVIGGAETYSLITGWINGDTFRAPEINVLSSAEDIANGFQSIFKAIDDDDPGKTAKAVKDAAENIAMVCGLPVKNVETYLMASIRRIQPEAAMQYDNFFGGLNKGDLKGMDADTIGSAVGIIMNSRTGANLERAATDELSRLYAAGFTDAIPSAIPDSFEYGGNTVKIKDRGKYRETWGGTVGDNLEELISSKDYRAADDKTKQAMIRKLYQYATVQARMGADPQYTAEGNSTYGWTLKADEAMDAGIDLPVAIAALTTFSGLKADTENGKTIVSKKAKVFDYINGLDLDSEQKDLLYELAGYEKGLENAPWHGGSGDVSGKTGGNKKTAETYEAEKKKAAADPNYTAPGWTIWTETAVKAGIKAEDAITHYNALAGMKADYDQYGKAITGSKKDKVCAYIDALDLTADQKDVLYLSVYKENSLRFTPWHGWTGDKKKTGSRSRRRGGRRRSGGSTSARKPVQVGKLAKGYSSNSGIDASALFGTSGSGRSRTQNASAASDLLEIINKHYGGNALAAAMDGGKRAKGRTTVDFKL